MTQNRRNNEHIRCACGDRRFKGNSLLCVSALNNGNRELAGNEATGVVKWRQSNGIWARAGDGTRSGELCCACVQLDVVVMQEIELTGTMFDECCWCGDDDDECGTSTISTHACDDDRMTASFLSVNGRAGLHT